MTHQSKSYKKFVASAATATLVATALVPTASAAASDFTDVSKDYKEAVDYIVEHGFAQGTTETTFGTAQNISRGDAAVMIANALNLDTANAPDAGFQDVNNRVAPAVNAIVEAEIASGRTSSKFDPAAYITRQEMAKMLANAYELEAETNAGFTDVNSNWIGFVSALKEAGITLGKTETTFAPEQNLTRGEFALFMFRAETVEPEPELPIDTDVEVTSVSAITLTEVTVEIDAPETDLEDAEVVVKNATGQVVPTKPVTIKAGATTATFAFVNPITVSPTSQWTVNGVAYAPANLEIVEVDSVTPNGKYLEVLFNKPLTSLESSEISIRNSNTLVRVGVESVKLASDGMSAQVTLLGSEDAAVIIQRLVSYDFSLTQNGTVTAKQFTLPGYITEQSVTAVDSKERTISIGSRTLKVPAAMAFDFEEALGQEVAVWYDKNGNVTKFNVVDHTVKYDAVKFEVRNGVTYAQLATEDKEYRLDNNAALWVRNATGVVHTGIANNAAYPSAKLVFNSQGQVQNIIALDQLNPALLVESVDGDIVNANTTEYNLKDYTVVKDGKTIALSDLNAGDVVYYNQSVKFAEVYSNSVTGKIEAVYAGQFKVDGKVYDNAGHFVTADNYDGLDEDALEAFKAADKEVTIYFDRAGNVELVSGTVAEVVSNTSISYLTKDGKQYSDIGSDHLLLNTYTAKGETVEERIKVEDLTSAADLTNLYKVGQDPIALSSTADPTKLNPIKGFELVESTGTYTLNAILKDNTLVPTGIDVNNSASDTLDAQEILKVTKNDAGKVVGLSLQDTFATGINGVKVTDKTIGAANSQIKPSTPVFIEVYEAPGYSTFKSVSATTFGELDKSIVDIDDVTVYGTAADVAYLVIKDHNINQPSDVTNVETVISAINYSADGTKVANLHLFENGVAKSYEIDNVTTQGLEVGNIVNAEINDKTGKVSDLTKVTGEITNSIDTTDVTAVNTATGKVTLKNNITYTKATSGIQIYEIVEVNGKDTVVARDFNYLATLKEDNVLELSYLNGNAKYFDTIVITKNKDLAGPGTPGTPETPGSQYLSVADVTEGATGTLTLNVTGTTFSSNADTFVDVSDLPDGYTLGAVTRDTNNQLSISITGNDDFDTDVEATVTVYAGGLNGVTTTETQTVTFVAVDEDFEATTTTTTATLAELAGAFPTWTVVSETALTTTPDALGVTDGFEYSVTTAPTGGDLNVAITADGVITFSVDAGAADGIYEVVIAGTGKFAGKSVKLNVEVVSDAVTDVTVQ